MKETNNVSGQIQQRLTAGAKKEQQYLPGGKSGQQRLYQKNNRRNAGVKKDKELIGLLCLLFCSLFIYFRLGTQQVDGQSMEPTFAHQDRVIIWKTQQPQRNDIVTFEPEGKPGESYVKRVIGVSGDHLILRKTTLYLIPKELPQPEIDSSVQIPLNLPKETVTVEVAKAVADRLVNYKNIPEGCYFVAGDNRNHSTDSRSFGWIDEQQIAGTVIYRYYPWQSAGRI